jgi:hypothetical protein
MAHQELDEQPGDQVRAFKEKVAVVGVSFVGKTCLIRRFVTGPLVTGPSLRCTHSIDFRSFVFFS